MVVAFLIKTTGFDLDIAFEGERSPRDTHPASSKDQSRVLGCFMIVRNIENALVFSCGLKTCSR